MTLFISPTELNEPKAVYVFLWWTGEAGGGIIMNDLYLKSLRAKVVSSLFDRRELRQIFCEKRWVQKYLSLLTWREKNLFFVAMKCSLRFDKFLSPFILIVNWRIVTRRTTVGKLVLMCMHCMREFAHWRPYLRWFQNWLKKRNKSGTNACHIDKHSKK